MLNTLFILQGAFLGDELRFCSWLGGAHATVNHYRKTQTVIYIYIFNPGCRRGRELRLLHWYRCTTVQNALLLQIRQQASSQFNIVFIFPCPFVTLLVSTAQTKNGLPV